MNNKNLSAKEISDLTELLKRVVWSDKDTRERIQRSGVNVIPCDYYSSVPSVHEIESSFEYSSKTPPYLNETIFNHDILLRTLEKLIVYSSEFNPETNGDEENCKENFWGNSQFSYSDAMSYYCFIRELRPSNLIE